jgi:hypothetical protein
VFKTFILLFSFGSANTITVRAIETQTLSIKLEKGLADQEPLIFWGKLINIILSLLLTLAYCDFFKP